MINRILSNPFYIYILAFSCCIGLYFLSWSNLFSVLNTSTLLFFLFTFLVCFLIGNYMSGMFTQTKMALHIYKANGINRRKLFFINLVISSLFILEIFHFGTIPLISTIEGGFANEGYGTFGIPTIHVVVVTFSSYYAVWMFQKYLVTSNRLVLFYYLLILFWFFVIVNRGSILMILTSSFFLYSFKKKFTFKAVFRSSILILCILYLFGLLGNLRINSENLNTSNFILELGGANDNFRESKIPDSFFWTYCYLCSPLANFQETINRTPVADYSSTQIIRFFTGEFLPDFISKRIFDLIGKEPTIMKQVNESFNVGGIYSRPFAYLGWIGVLSIFVYLVSFVFFYIILLNDDNKYYATAIAIIGNIMFFSVFENMIWFSGLSFQLIYPLLFNFIGKLKISKNNN